MAESPDLSLLENGLDFLLHAVEHLEGALTQRDLKQALVNLGGGVELVLKERLRREDWQLLFEDMSKANLAAFADGSLFSARPETVIKRLDAAGVEINGADRHRLKVLQHRRNQLLHHTVSLDTVSVTALSAAIVGFALDFIARELDDDLSNRASAYLESLRRASGRFNAFVEARMTAIAPQLTAAYALVGCPHCAQDTVEIDDGLRCHFCGYTADARTGSEAFATDVLGVSYYDVIADGEYWPVSFCPGCGAETLVDEGRLGGEMPMRRWICFTCAEGWDDDELTTCLSCGAFYPDTHELSICEDCFAARVAND